MTVLELPIPAGALMPQAKPMLLLDDLTACTGGAGAGRADIREGHFFLDGAGRLDAAACVESLAQLAGAVKGYETKLAGGNIRFGYLVGIKNFAFEGAVRVGDALTLESRRVFEMDAVSIAEGRILRGADCLVSGTLKLYETESLPPHPRRAPAVAGKTTAKNWLRRLCPESLSAIHRSLIESLTTFSLEPADGQDGERRASGAFLLDDSFAGFEGHFPGYPIQPGVVTLEMGLVLAECALGGPLEFCAIEWAKFNLPAYPNEILEGEVRVSPAQDAAARSVAARIWRGGEPIASFSFLAAEPPGA